MAADVHGVIQMYNGSCGDFYTPSGLCSTVQVENMEVELKVKPQEVAGKKRVAHEAKHSEVNVKPC